MKKSGTKDKKQEAVYPIVVFYGSHTGGCGYCKVLDEKTNTFIKENETSVSVGCHIYHLPTNLYEEMMFRNMRRSGEYFYQPQNPKTCCPQYAIRLNALEFKPNKKQRKVLRKMQNFLEFDNIHGKKEETQQLNNIGNNELDKKKRKIVENNVNDQNNSRSNELTENFQNLMKDNLNLLNENFNNKLNVQLLDKQVDWKDLIEKSKIQKAVKKVKKLENDKVLYSCNISFLIYGLLSKLKIKDINKKEIGEIILNILNENKFEEKNDIVKIDLEDNGYINFIVKEDLLSPRPQGDTHHQKSKVNDHSQSSNIKQQPKHKLETILLDSTFREEEYLLFEKYQRIVHLENDSTRKGYTRFLCDSSLLNMDTSSLDSDNKPLNGYGTFHLQYRLDGKLIAVSVLDILPTGVSSVYFFYDTDYNDLSLGVYSVCHETEMTAKVCRDGFPNFKYMYLGFYIHSCKKMRYKGEYSPSEILCQETYTWVPLDEKLTSRLEKEKYFQFNESLPSIRNDPIPENDGLLFFFNRQAIPYSIISSVLPIKQETKDNIELFKKIFGKKLALESNLLYFLREEDLDE
ncbi:hypothetical protein ABK040_006655 [Willaertia magna]